MRSRSARAAVLLALAGTLVCDVQAGAAPTPGRTRRLGASDDVVAAAIGLSAGAFEDGTASIVALGRNDLFPDSLAGAALAGTDGPVLFTPGGPTATLPASVRAEIDRVLPDPSGCDGSSEIAVLGGTGAVSAAVESSLAGAGYCVRRYAGTDRVTTALAIARRVLELGGDASQVLVSRSDNWPDSATGSAYAAATGHPVVVTPPGGLDPLVAAFLSETSPEEIVLLGGTGALSPSVEQSARQIAPTTRVAGTSRDGTAAAIAAELWGPLAPTGVTLVNGFASNGWAYAIAGAVNAAIDGTAELFVEQSAVPQATRDQLADMDDAFSIVAGPSSLIGDPVVVQVEASRTLTTPPGAAPLRYRDRVFDAVTATRGVVYGSATAENGAPVDLVMDVHEPEGDTVDVRPAIVWIHGGAYFLGSRTDNVAYFTDWALRGYVVASIDYRLVSAPGCLSDRGSELCATGIRFAVEDAQEAVRYVHDHAADLGVDPTRIAIAGHSAGGTTGLALASLASEDPDSWVRAVVATSGVANPGVEFSAGDAPTLMINVDEDPLVSYDDARSTHEDALANGNVAELVTIPSDNHDFFLTMQDEIMGWTTSFLWWQMNLQAAVG